MRQSVWLCLCGCVVMLWSSVARGETTEIRVAQQNGLGYLPLMIMEEQNLIEKHAQAAGLPNLKVAWSKLGGPSAMNDALLARELDIATGGAPGMITLWAKTRGTKNEVRGVSAVSSTPIWLVTSNPKVKSIRDFGPQDKIAVTAVKVALQAILLQMAAAKEFGLENYAKLDPLTVALPHPDAAQALISGSGTITAHFSNVPFQYEEVKKPGVRTILTSGEIVGGPFTSTVAWSVGRFVNENPKTYAAFLAALQEAVEMINREKKAAAEAFQRSTRSKTPVDEILQMVNDSGFLLTPTNVMQLANFMVSVGSVKTKPESWKELFFPNIHHLSGS
ncbi:MAG TPA: ABC transporter substrate-binding protein [Spirochaetia bacterium]|nr:ABC transporter substrate-binding protein [Spirochaetia bacterium]